VPHLEGRGVLHRRNLLADRFADFTAAMTRIHAPQTRDGIEDLPAVGRPVVHALSLCQHPGIGLELAVRRERHPEGFHRVALQRGIGGHGGFPDLEE
jgi:hypothetical protein